MYSNIESVNILTSLLVDHIVQRVVVCPGSRNAPLVHNFHICEQEEFNFRCYPVTDERSAGFFALGIAQNRSLPVAVCVTSGSALLNLLPAVAEAYYQNLPLIVISADRPAAWIDQLDGQTLPQSGALAPFVRRSVSLPECRTEEDAWLCNRLVNEALQHVLTDSCGPVHINVPISEPLFHFTYESLPRQRFIHYQPRSFVPDTFTNHAFGHFFMSERPMVVVGQLPSDAFMTYDMERLQSYAVVLHESLAPIPGITHFDEVLHALKGSAADEYRPSFVLYLGGTVVSKRLKHFLRQMDDHAQVWAVDPHGEIHDPTMHLSGVIDASPHAVVSQLAQHIRKGIYEWNDVGRIKELKIEPTAFRHRWQQVLDAAAQHAQQYEPGFSQMAAVRCLEERLSQLDRDDYRCHYANSTAIRLANIYAPHHVYCNRGVNGIEGSLSTAAGFATSRADRTVCVIGDLSFFYDQNALWNQNLDGSLRVLLLNNGCGGIFHQLAGLEDSPARDRYVAAAHSTSAEGICRQNGVTYLRADDMESLRQGMDTLLYKKTTRPVLLEVFTDPDQDEHTFKNYYNTLQL